MDNKKDISLSIKRLSQDNNYFNNVFKKTEKILSVTLYILSEINDDRKTNLHLDTIKDRVVRIHEASLQTLMLQEHEQTNGLIDFQYQLVGLESSLRMAQLSGVLPEDIFNLINEQLDAIYRYINNHYVKPAPISVEELTQTVVEKSTPSPSKSASTKSPSSQPRRQQRVQIPSGDISSDAYLVYSQLTDRAERIKTVLEAKPQATVKDVAEVITDVSEKTIQRELNSLIEKGQVVREGERRWSKYSVKK